MQELPATGTKANKPTFQYQFGNVCLKSSERLSRLILNLMRREGEREGQLGLSSDYLPCAQPSSSTGAEQGRKE